MSWLEGMTNDHWFRFPFEGITRMCTFKAFFLAFLWDPGAALFPTRRWQRRVWVETRGFWQVLSFTHILENLDMKRAWDNLWASSTLSLMLDRTTQKSFGHTWECSQEWLIRRLLLSPMAQKMEHLFPRIIPQEAEGIIFASGGNILRYQRILFVSKGLSVENSKRFGRVKF